jgi:pimeloyl-ACP methyl ester carboxylesterase
MGGRIALDLALRHTSMLNKLILVSTAAKVPKTWQRSWLFVLRRLPFKQGRFPQPYYASRRQAEASISYDLQRPVAPDQNAHAHPARHRDHFARYELAGQMRREIAGSELAPFSGGPCFCFGRAASSSRPSPVF